MNLLHTWIGFSLIFAPGALADPNPDLSAIDALRQMIVELKSEVAQLKHQDDAWLNDQRVDEIRELVSDVLADADTRANLLGESATTGYKNGWFITTADGRWKLKFNFQLQVRWVFNDAELQPNNYGFEQRRSKFNFSGHIIDPSWTYKITATWNRSGSSVTEDAWIAKNFDDGGWVKFGQFKAGFLRENINSSSKQLGAERTSIHTAFTYGWTQGIAAGWKNDDVNLFVQYTDGPNRSNTPALGPATHAWVGRAEFKFGEAGWNDFGYLTSRAGDANGLLVGVAYETYDSDTGTFEYGNALGGKSRGWTVDASARGDGWNIFAYFVKTTGESKTTGVEQDSSGYVLQGGVLVSDHVELFAQYEHGEIDGATFTDGESNDMSVIRFGFNYWPTAGSNVVKWTTDIAWAQDSIADGAGSSISSANWISSGNGWRDDTGAQDGRMLLRTQLQLVF